MRISKKNFLILLEQNLQEMPMDFPRSVSVKRPNPNYDENAPENADNPKMIDVEEPFTERPHRDLQSKLQTQNTPLKKVPMPQAQGNQNFQEKLASETYEEVIRRVKQAVHQPGENLIQLMYNAVYAIDEIESEHRQELEKFAVQAVLDIYKIPHDSVNIHAKLVSINQGVDNTGFGQPQDQENPDAPEIDDNDVETPNIDPEEEEKVEEDYVDKLENFNLERAKRRLLNAMIQGAAHSAYNLYKYFQEGLNNIVGADSNIMDLYATMMAVNDTNYWHLSDMQIQGLASSVAGRAEVKFPQAQGDGEGGDMGDMGGDDDDNEEGNNGDEGGEEQGGGTDTLGNPIDLNKPQVYVAGINFPVLFHEVMKGLQKLIAGHGMAFPGYDSSNPRHVNFVEMVKQHEDVLDYEMWDLRLGPAIWQRYRLAHPEDVVDPDQRIELQRWVQSYIYKLPARKFLALMKEIMEGTEKAKNIISTLVQGIEQMLANEDYEEAMSQYEDELDDIDQETEDDDLVNLLKGIPGIRLSDEEEDDEDDGGEYV